tara:strand:- start:464 stop:1012 length:549 start_codon:yes stop_codon:yes gene_type:complete
MPKNGLFFGVMIPPTESGQFAACYHSFQRIYRFTNRPIGPDRMHMSLCSVYSGDDLGEQDIRTAIRAGDAIRFGPFPVTFDRALTYRNTKSKMPFVLAAPDSADPVNGLRFQLGREYSKLSGSIGYRQRPIQPHVTLVWDQISVPENSIEPLTIIVQEFALVRSYIGFGKYDILNRWPLVRL